MQRTTFSAIVPAAGVGKRMAADRPKQYLPLGDRCVLEHTLARLIAHPAIDHVFVVLGKADPYFDQLALANAPWLTRVEGGQERVNSVLAGVKAAIARDGANAWALVHDAARPCLDHHDLDKLLALYPGNRGGILAAPVRDTMKRCVPGSHQVKNTEQRDNLWHALTPQFFPLGELLNAIEQGLAGGHTITDEASAMELAGHPVALVEGNSSNIKITRREDLALADFYLTREQP